MVSISSRRTSSVSAARLLWVCLGATAVLMVLVVSISNAASSTGLCDLSGLVFTDTTPTRSSSDATAKAAEIKTTTITTMEQIEEQLKRIDPIKAAQWRAFLENDGKLLPESSSSSSVRDQVAPVSARDVSRRASTKTIEQLDAEVAVMNSLSVRDWRRKFSDAAATEPGEAHRDSVKLYSQNAFAVANLRKCKHVFLDFGSNVGDSLLKVIDSFVPEFDSGIENGKKLHHSLNTTTGSIGPGVYDHFRHNPTKWILPKWVKQKVEDYNSFKRKRDKSIDPVYPEDYCFYGVEGNPHFTALLRREEIQVMNMIPRPIRHLHFLTEHVGAASNGPTTLYLDTVNAKDNFWGSSIINSHQDVVKSGGNTGTPVMGITLTSLIEQTVAPGGHVMIKIDIEGGEYQLLEEAINSTILCKLTKDMNVKVDMLNERHNAKIVGSEEPGLRWKAIGGDNKIKGCGVGYGWGVNQ